MAVLSYLRVRGLALLDDVALTFAPGMNVLTGETGAGKSIIVGALSLLRGARGRGELVREGAEAAVVDAQFEPEAKVVARLHSLLEAHGVLGEGDGESDPAEVGELVLQRTLSRTGRGRSFVQSTLTTQAALGEIGEELIDICSQHEHHFLTHPSRHLEVLDSYAGLEDDVADYEAQYRTWRDALARLDELRESTRDRAQRIDYLKFQIDEIDRVAPEPGEYEALRNRLRLLRDAQKWVSYAREAQLVLYEDDDAIASRLGTLLERARSGAEDSELLTAIHEQLVTARVACEEAAATALRLAEELELDPEELALAEERLHELESLRRKHGMDLDDLAARADAMRNELEDLEHAEDHLAALESRCEELEAACRLRALRLRTTRQKAAAGLAKAVVAELAALQIPNARLEVLVAPLRGDGAAAGTNADDADEVDDAGQLGPSGMDHVEFMFSANLGEKVGPLRRVASGGELSRVLLAIKGVLATGDRVATYVFDEVDAGVGGAVAEAIGLRLKRASGAHQVLCITHLPQIAAFADAHYRVEKRTKGGRTTTCVVRLSDEERVEELARMLGGANVTASARSHAAALIAAAKAAAAAPATSRSKARAERAGQVRA